MRKNAPINFVSNGEGMRILRRTPLDQVWMIEEETGCWYLRGPRGHVITRAKWAELKDQVDRFFEIVTDAEIEEANAEADEQLRRESRQPETMPAASRKPSGAGHGYIYLLHGEGTRWYKLGISKRPGKRFKQIGAKTPFACQTIAVFPVEDMLAMETAWHERFADKRAEGEWFELDRGDIALFQESQGQAGEA